MSVCRVPMRGSREIENIPICAGRPWNGAPSGSCNLVDAARAVIAAADHRRESRGAHYRADFPEPDPSLDGEHSLRAAGGSFRYGALAETYATTAR